MLSFHVKFVQTDRRTTAKQYAPDLLIRGHKKAYLIHVNISLFPTTYQKGFFLMVIRIKEPMMQSFIKIYHKSFK